MLLMNDINQRQKKLNITHNEWFAVWMLGRVRKRKRVDGYELQALRDVVKKGGDDIIKDFQEEFKEVRVEGKRIKTSPVHCAGSSLGLSSGDHLLDSKYTKEELEALYMGTSSEARKRFQRR